MSLVFCLTPAFSRVLASTLIGGLLLCSPASKADDATDLARSIVVKADEVRFPRESFQVKITIDSNQPGETSEQRTYRVLSRGNESTIISFVTTLIHHGMVYVGLPYSCPELADFSEVKGGSPWGAATIAGADGSRQPSAKELAQARFQGAHVAGIAAKLSK